MLKLEEIYLGDIDAKNEVLGSDPQELQRFVQSYVKPPSFSLDKYKSRQKYFIVGLKGTGKTALLRYVSLKLEEEESAVSRFILFKSEIDESLRKDFAHASRVQIVEENSDAFDGDDYEAVWRWFIYRKIADAMQSASVDLFQRNGAFSDFNAIVNSEALSKSGKLGVMRLIPSIKKGHVEISRSPKLGLDLEWDSNGMARVNFNELVRRADQAFLELGAGTQRLNLFFDELELNYGTAKQHQRDARLIRDLIVSIERLNAIAKTAGFNFCLYAAVRSEVLISVDSLGKEINKPVTSFGSEILWNRPGLDATQQPLLNIIEQRINNARKEKGLPELEPTKVWSEYFPDNIHKLKPQVYILHNSWYRPRDIVRLLLTAQEQYPSEYKFAVQTLEAIRKKYSSASWVELTEELKAKYKAPEIEGIKYIFYGYKQISSLSELTERSRGVSENHKETSDLLARHSIKEVLKDLFRIGAVGNIDKRRERMRFSFRGDDEILFDDEIFVHNALRAHLSI
ncbi:hypothetical protein D9M70_333650 [compost metagenome]